MGEFGNVTKKYWNNLPSNKYRNRALSPFDIALVSALEVSPLARDGLLLKLLPPV
jgi:hypothetical protein